MVYAIQLPNGQLIDVDDNVDPAIAQARIAADYPEMFPDMGKQGLRRNKLVADGKRKPNEYTTRDRFSKAFNDFESQSGEFRGLIEDRLGNQNEGAGLGRIAANRLQAKDAENIAPPAMDYHDVNGVGSAASFLGQNLIQSSPQMLSSAVGALGAAATLPVSAPVALVAGLGAGAAANLPSYGGQNIDDQIQALTAKGFTEAQALQKIQLGPAAVAAALSSGLDAIPFSTAIGRPLASVGKPVIESIGKRVAASKIGETAAARIAGRVAERSLETALDEAPVEAMQQALQIGQSAYATGDNVGDALYQRRGEIGDAAIAGGLVGAGLGGAGSMVFRGHKASENPVNVPQDKPPVLPLDNLTPGQRGKFIYDGVEYEGTYRGVGPYKTPVFRVQNEQFPAGQDFQVQPRDILAMQQEQALLPAPDSTLYAGSSGVGTRSAMDALRKQISPLLPEETQPQAGDQYGVLQKQIADYQNKEADRRSAAEDSAQSGIEQQNREKIDLKRQQDLEYLANEKLINERVGTDISNAVDTPRLTYDSVLAVTPDGVAIPRGQVLQQATQKKQAKADTAQKRIDDGYDPSIEAPAQVIDRAPLPAEPEPKAPSIPMASPDFEAGPFVKNKYADYTKPSQQQRKWIQGTVADLNETSGGSRIFMDAEGQGGTQEITGSKGNTPQWFSDYNKGAVRSQKERGKANRKNTLTDDSRKAVLEPATQILTRKQVTDVANKILEGKPLGKSEVKVAEVIYSQAKDTREQSARQIMAGREERAQIRDESLGDAAEPNLAPRDTSLDDIPFDAPTDMPNTSKQRFKGETAINRTAAERGIVTSKVIDNNAHYDPLTEIKYFPEDANIAPEALANEPKTKPKNNKWKKEKIEVTLDDGSKELVSAGAITDNLKKMADSLQKLKACLG